MQESPRPFYARVGALSAVALLAVSGGFIASPAMAAPITTEPDSNTATEPSAVVPVEETTVDLPPGLAEAVLRDLDMTMEEFEAAGELGKKAADALPALQAIEGFTSVSVEDGRIVITGTGDELKALALEIDATLVAPAVVEGEEVTGDEAAPAKELVETPAVPATDAAVPTLPAAPSEGSVPAEETAPTEEVSKQSLPGNYVDGIRALRSDYIANVGVQGLKSVMWDGAQYVINVESADSTLARVMEGTGNSPAQSFAAKYEGVKVVESPGGLTSTEDVVNGQGYATDANSACSLGFSGFNRQGDTAVITAGHCSNDGEAVETALTVPASDPAAGGPGGELGSLLGTFGFNQFGGAGNTPVDPETIGNIGTDIAVINDINTELDLLPEVTHWEDAADLTTETTKLTGTTDAVVGAPVCKSGRTTGWSCGEVTALGEFFVGGDGGENDVRGVMGFEAVMEEGGQAAPGDSGGPTISGTLAVGINSAIGTRGVGDDAVDVTLSTSLSDGLKYTDGYSVAFHVEAPKVTSVADDTVLTDETISGTTTPGTSVVLTRGTATETLEVSADGTWSFTAPSTVPAGGELDFSMQALNGYNKSAVVDYTLTVKEAPLAAPTITSPAISDSIADSLDTITGTGDADATVTLKLTGEKTVGDTEEGESSAAATESVDFNGTATVGADGTWDWKLDEALSYGNYTVTAFQEKAGKTTSPTATSSFSVVLAAPAITSVTEGQDFVEGSTPANISGTGKPGAEVSVNLGDVDGKAASDEITTTVDSNGNWSVSGIPALSQGEYHVVAAQFLSGASSSAAMVKFTVTAAVAAPPAPPAPTQPAPENTPAPTQPAPENTPAPDNNGDGLPDTGASGLGVLAGAGALLLAGGAGVLLVNRRRRMHNA